MPTVIASQIISKTGQLLDQRATLHYLKPSTSEMTVHLISRCCCVLNYHALESSSNWLVPLINLHSICIKLNCNTCHAVHIILIHPLCTIMSYFGVACKCKCHSCNIKAI